MTERFKKYLEEQFRAIPPTRSAMEFRKQTLQQLEEYAQDCRIKGMDNDEAIYKVCIASLGDFQKTLEEFQQGLQEKPKRVSRGFRILSVAVGAVAVILALYLALSITGVVAWRTSWLILFGAVVVGACAPLALIFIKSIKDGKTIAPRLTGSAIATLLLVFAYLLAHMCFDKPVYDWYCFLIIPLAIAWINVAVAYIVKNKSAVLETIASTFLTAVMLYVMLGVASIMPWHPGWLLVAGSAIIGIAVVIIYIASLRKERAKLVLKKHLDGNDTDDKFYTEW